MAVVGIDRLENAVLEDVDIDVTVLRKDSREASQVVLGLQELPAGSGVGLGCSRGGSDRKPTAATSCKGSRLGSVNDSRN